MDLTRILGEGFVVFYLAYSLVEVKKVFDKFEENPYTLESYESELKEKSKESFKNKLSYYGGKFGRSIGYFVLEDFGDVEQ